MAGLPDGLYESILDEDLQQILEDRPELRAVFGKIEADEEPSRYAAFLAKVLERALHLEVNSAARVNLCNAIVERLASISDGNHLLAHPLVPAEKLVLLEITPSRYLQPGIPRPETPLSESSCLLGHPAIHSLFMNSCRRCLQLTVLMSWCRSSSGPVCDC